MRTVCALVLVIVLGLVAGAGAENNDEEIRFRSLAPEYYRRYYAMAEAEAVPESGLREDEMDNLRTRLRGRSEEWAAALAETLSLRPDGTFVLAFRNIREVSKDVLYADAVPDGPAAEWQGRWARDGTALSLAVERIDGQELPRAIDWRASWAGDEIQIPAWRGAVLGPSILRGCGQSTPSSEDRLSLAARIGDVESRVEAARRDLAELGAKLWEQGKGTDVGPPARASASAYWLGVLRGAGARSAQAVLELTRARAVEVAPDLIHAVRSSGDGSVRILASVALGEWRVVDAVPVLIEELTDDNPLLRTAAEDALVRITGRGVSAGPEGPPSTDVVSPIERRWDWEEWWRGHESDVRKRIPVQAPLGGPR